MTAFGAGARALIGQRSRGRALKQMRAGAPAGRANPNYYDDDAAHSLAIAIWVTGDATTASRAAFCSVMLREGFEPTKAAIDALADRRPEKHALIDGEIRRLRDKLYRDAGLAEHVSAVRAHPELVEAARDHRDRLVNKAAHVRRFTRAAAMLQDCPDPDCP